MQIYHSSYFLQKAKTLSIKIKNKNKKQIAQIFTSQKEVLHS